MRWALLCDDLSAKPVVDRLDEQFDGHRLTHAVRVTHQADTLLHQREGVTYVNHWEDLLIAREIDAVLVGGSDTAILEGAKQLATAGFPLLFVPTAAQSSTFVYELSLIRDDNQVTLFPLFWHQHDSAVQEFKQILQRGELGRMQYLQLQRGVARASTSSPIAQADVDTELLGDVNLLRWLVGDYDQVTALRTAATNDGVLMQSVVLSGRMLPEANWSICPLEQASQWRLTVRAEQGQAELTRDDASQRWVCEINGRQVEGNASQTAGKILSSFAEVRQKAQAADAVAIATISREWGELVKGFETVDATHRSVRRRRTIELHFEPMSERAIFKTQMTAIGCGLIMATLFLMLVYLGVASFIEPVSQGQSGSEIQAGAEFHPDPEDRLAAQSLPLTHQLLRVLRLLVFAPLVVFLVAQFLLLLTRPSSSEQIDRREN